MSALIKEVEPIDNYEIASHDDTNEKPSWDNTEDLDIEEAIISSLIDSEFEINTLESSSVSEVDLVHILGATFDESTKKQPNLDVKMVDDYHNSWDDINLQNTITSNDIISRENISTLSINDFIDTNSNNDSDMSLENIVPFTHSLIREIPPLNNLIYTCETTSLGKGDVLDLIADDELINLIF